MHRGKEKQIYKKQIQVYSDVQKVINEVHYVLRRKLKVNPTTFPQLKVKGKISTLQSNLSVRARLKYGHLYITDSFQCPDKILIYFLLKNLCKTDSL